MMFENYLQTQELFSSQNYEQRMDFYQNSTPQSQKKYIQQFLQEGVLQPQKLEDFSNQQKTTDSDKSEEVTHGLSPNYQRRMKSQFHNYQKHLIITLRKTVKMDIFQSGEVAQIVKQLWKSFNQSKIYNKSLLRILFGESSNQQQINLLLFRKQGFKQILEKFNAQDIKKAQTVLRKHVLKHFQENSLDSLLNSRKLPDRTKQLFKKYIMEFVVQLKEGSVMKRLPKSRKKQIFKSL